MRLDIRLREREAEARSTERTRRRRIDLEERLEDLRDLVARDADARVADDELDRRRLTAMRLERPRVHGDPDAPAVRRELHGVRDQRRHDLPDLAAVAVH